MIIGLTGPNASGKGTVAEYLKKKGFAYFSLSDIIREEATRRGLSHSRENLIEIGNRLRKEHGFGVLAELTNEKIRKIRSTEGKADAVVDSIRSPFEIQELRKNNDFLLLGINAPVELRFERARSRGRIENASTVEQFREMEAKENLDKEGSQQLSRCYEMADVKIMNASDINELHSKIDALIDSQHRGEDDG